VASNPRPRGFGFTLRQQNRLQQSALGIIIQKIPCAHGGIYVSRDISWDPAYSFMWLPTKATSGHQSAETKGPNESDPVSSPVTIPHRVPLPPPLFEVNMAHWNGRLCIGGLNARQRTMDFQVSRG
jgi:hypothetical protein